MANNGRVKKTEQIHGDIAYRNIHKRGNSGSKDFIESEGNKQNGKRISLYHYYYHQPGLEHYNCGAMTRLPTNARYINGGMCCSLMKLDGQLMMVIWFCGISKR